MAPFCLVRPLFDWLTSLFTLSIWREATPHSKRNAFCLLLALLGLAGGASYLMRPFTNARAFVSTTVVISEFRVRGPNGGNDEFVEIYNLGNATVDIGGWKLKGSNSSGTTSTRATVASGVMLSPGCHFLFTNSASSGYSGSVPGNQTYSTGITDDGGIAITKADDTIVDQVGMSTGSAYKEGTVLASLGSSTASNLNRGYERKPGGTSGSGTDTDNNSTDFQQLTPSDPQNQASGCITMLTLSCTPSTFAETAGANVSTCTVTRVNASTAAALTVTLTSNDTSEATVPASVTIPMSSASTTFMVDAVDDLLADGTQTVTLTASASTFVSGTTTLMVTDDDTPMLTLSCVPTTFSEGAGANASTCTVSRNTSTAASLLVTLMSNDTSEANVPASVTIPVSSASTTFMVDAVDDLLTDGTQTVTITASANTFVSGTAMLMVTNDDFIFIHDIQGSGLSSPLVGQSVAVRGIVTLLKSNGFFLQEELADYDADPNTSEGIFVFTSVPPTVLVGAQVSVNGTVVEFNGLTEISATNANITTNNTGNTLPTAITLTAADLPSNASYTQPQLEKYEGMRLTVTSLTTVAPNDEFFDVYTVITGQLRPFREPGISAGLTIPPDPTSGGIDPNIPIWDRNPERLKVDTNGRAGSTGETMTSNVVITNVTGPLDFAFSEYRLIPDATIARSANMSAVPVPTPTSSEYTVAGYNIENFNNDATQRQKAALTIRDVMKLPDIIGTVEIYDLADLQALATELQTISGVTYSAHLIEQDGVSNDNDQDVGFLVKTSRVSVTSVMQERQTETFINPTNNMAETLHDRPPLVLRGTVNPAGPNPQPVIVVVNHTRSFIDSELTTAEGVRVRAKRKAQAESIAGLLQELQANNPFTPVIAVGDYNAFQFSNGYDDPISVMKGTPTADDQIVVDQSPDVVNPDFYNLIEDIVAEQRYSFVFEGTPQVLDHMLVNTVARAHNTRIAVARVNSDFPEAEATVFASNATRPERNSDHDPVVGYFKIPAADLAVTKVDTPDPATSGGNLTYTITVTNNGPDAAANVNLNDPLPAGTTFVSLAAPGGWTCMNPAVGVGGTVSCSNPSFAVGSAMFTLTVKISGAVANGSVLSNTATVSSLTYDPTPGNEMGKADTTVFMSTTVPLRMLLSDPLICTGDANTLSVHAEITNLNNTPGPFTFRASLPAQLSGVANTCVITSGTCTVNPGEVTATGVIAGNQTISIDYKVRVAPNTAPGTNLCVDSVATLNNVLMAAVQACTVLNCPAANGPPVNAQMSGQKAGAVLVFPYYVSKAAEKRDTRLSITNTGAAQTYAHVFFIDGTTCAQSDLFLCLTPNATFSFKASEYDPEATGWVLAVAVDANGLPVPNNGLIGNAFVQDGQYVDNYNAQSFVAHSPALAAINGNTATLFFDGGSYDGVPSQFAAEIQSPVDAAGQRIVTVGLSGDLTTRQMTGAGQVGSGLAINGNEKPSGSFSAFLSGACQALATISTNSPRVPNGLGAMIPSGQSGTLKFNVGAAAGLLLTPRTAAWRGIRSLHTTAQTTTTITIPLFRPVC